MRVFERQGKLINLAEVSSAWAWCNMQHAFWFVRVRMRGGEEHDFMIGHKPSDETGLEPEAALKMLAEIRAGMEAGDPSTKHI